MRPRSRIVELPWGVECGIGIDNVSTAPSVMAIMLVFSTSIDLYIVQDLECKWDGWSTDSSQKMSDKVKVFDKSARSRSAGCVSI
jgi:hypothetical protein